MNLYRLSVSLITGFFGAVLLLVPSGCGPKKGEDSEKDSLETPTAPPLISVNGELFSIPSPIQSSALLKKSGAKYSQELLNQTSNLPAYSNNFKKAVNLGIYGADLGYIIIYSQTQNSLGYLNAIKKLSDDIGVSGAFDEKLMKRFEKNMSNNDSLLSIFTSGYRSADGYLKNNDRNEVSGLVIAGGWIESMYFTCKVLKNDFADKNTVIRRVAEQKYTLDKVIKLLTPYYQNPELPEYTELADQLIELYHVFEELQAEYKYVPSTTDVASKTTTIRSLTDIRISPEQLNEITSQIDAIRNNLVK
jgi:hypothetical protein